MLILGTEPFYVTPKICDTVTPPCTQNGSSVLLLFPSSLARCQQPQQLPSCLASLSLTSVCVCVCLPPYVYFSHMLTGSVRKKAGPVQQKHHHHHHPAVPELCPSARLANTSPPHPSARPSR